MNTGGTQFGGRLEVYYNDEWGTVCGDGWGSFDATVACRQMGFVAVGASDSSRFGSGASSQSIWLDDVACNGPESLLIDCSHAGIGNDNCGHDEDIGIICIRGELIGFLYCVKLVHSETSSCAYCHEWPSNMYNYITCCGVLWLHRSFSMAGTLHQQQCCMDTGYKKWQFHLSYYGQL